jgi:hypothetical protein
MDPTLPPLMILLRLIPGRYVRFDERSCHDSSVTMNITFLKLFRYQLCIRLIGMEYSCTHLPPSSTSLFIHTMIDTALHYVMYHHDYIASCLIMFHVGTCQELVVQHEWRPTQTKTDAG